MRTSSHLSNPSRRLNAEVQQVNAHLQAAGAERQRAAEEAQQLHAANDRLMHSCAVCCHVQGLQWHLGSLCSWHTVSPGCCIWCRHSDFHNIAYEIRLSDSSSQEPCQRQPGKVCERSGDSTCLQAQCGPAAAAGAPAGGRRGAAAGGRGGAGAACGERQVHECVAHPVSACDLRAVHESSWGCGGAWRMRAGVSTANSR